MSPRSSISTRDRRSQRDSALLSKAHSSKEPAIPGLRHGLAAALEGCENYEIVDGNLNLDPDATLARLIETNHVELLGVSVMPGPQMISAMKSYSRTISQRAYRLGRIFSFGLRSCHAECIIRRLRSAWPGGKHAARTDRRYPWQPRLRQDSRTLLQGPFRHARRQSGAPDAMQGPDAFPWNPFSECVPSYLRPSYFGKRTGAHQASIDCPFQCSFCAVHDGSQQKMESPERTEVILRYIVRYHGMDGVQFYDMNFFMRADHTRELMERLTSLGLHWWCKGRIDAICRYSDETLEWIRKAG